MKKPSGGYSEGGYSGGYYYGEGYEGYAEAAVTPTRSIRDYLIMLRERIWWLVVTILVVFLGAALYTFNLPKQYRAVSTVEILRMKDRTVQFEGVVRQDVANVEDFNTQIAILNSGSIIQRVDDRIRGQLRRDFLQPFEEGRDITLAGPLSVPQILANNRSVAPQRLSLVVNILYTHPNPNVAAAVANFFAEEFIDFNRNQQITGSLRAVEDLRGQAEEQLNRIKEMEMRIADFKERNSTVSVERSSDIDNQQLIALNARVENDKQIYDEVRTKMDLINRSRQDGTPLWELNFIAVFPGVNELQSRLRLITIEIAQLAETFGPRHPRMIAARQSLNQAERELRDLVETAAISFRNDYNRASSNFENSRNRLEQQKRELIAIDRIRPEFNALMRDLDVSRQLYDHYLSRLQQASAMVAIDTQNARIIDNAVPPIRPFKPNIPLNLAIGLFMGVGLGFGLVFMLAILDDKVKTAFDIEASMGLPLIGIIPRISRVDPVEKARIVADNLDKHTVEAFRSTHSTLKLNEESRNAKVILTTSTIPSEGKSFISTNLAITFAGHGERTILVDCDLRMPNVAKSLDLPEGKGMLNYFSGEVELNDVIVKDFVPGMDVLPTGGRSKNATQVLTSAQFEELIHDLRLRYDKIVIDSPPLAPVSDALNILPLADGVIYVIRFNMAKRKTVNLNLRRLRESNIPVFGAILNNINASVAGYYYSDYYDRSYRHYYMQDNLTAQDTPLKAPLKTKRRQIENVPLEKV